MIKGRLRLRPRRRRNTLMPLPIGSVDAPLGYTLEYMHDVGLWVSARVDIGQRTVIDTDITLVDI